MLPLGSHSSSWVARTTAQDSRESLLLKSDQYDPGHLDANENGPRRVTPSQHVRLASLDIVRGLTMMVMIFVDEAGGAFPGISHSGWDGCTLADLVMPFFLFMVGCSMSFALRKFRKDRRRGTRFALIRGAKLFMLGLVLQGGGFPEHYRYGYNLATLRINGILQHIAIGYSMAACIDLWVWEVPKEHSNVDSDTITHFSSFSIHRYKWLVACSAVFMHVTLTYLVFVPDWTSEYGRPTDATKNGVKLTHEEKFVIRCGVRGAVASPECTVNSLLDRTLLGQDRLAVWYSNRLPECSACAPRSPYKVSGLQV
jgi:heparan-alpha-glucosaminide N-acetyltransferase